MAGLQLAWFIISLVILIFSFGVVGDFQGPNSTVAVRRGSSITLRCRAGQPTTVIADSGWSMNGLTFANVNGLLLTLSPFENFEIDNSDTTIGQMDLIITSAEFEDEGLLECEFNIDQQRIFQESTLTVEAQVTTVTVAINSVEGTEFAVRNATETEAVCTAYAGRPSVEIYWFDKANDPINGATEMQRPNTGDANTIDTISTVTFIPLVGDTSLECRTNGQNATDPRSQTVTLDVQYRPIVTVTYEDFTITCSVVANPRNGITYKIYLNDTISYTGNSATLPYNPNDYPGCVKVTVKCEASNTIGPGTGEIEDSICQGYIPQTESPTTNNMKGTTEGLNEQSTPIGLIAGIVAGVLVVIIIVVIIAVTFTKQMFCFDIKPKPNPDNGGRGSSVPLKSQTSTNADMVRNQPDTRQSLHKYEDEVKKPRVARSTVPNNSRTAPSAGGDKVGPVQGDRRPPGDNYKKYPINSQDDKDRGPATNYAQLEFQNGPTVATGKPEYIHPSSEEPTAYASISGNSILV